MRTAKEIREELDSVIENQKKARACGADVFELQDYAREIASLRMELDEAEEAEWAAEEERINKAVEAFELITSLLPEPGKKSTNGFYATEKTIWCEREQDAEAILNLFGPILNDYLYTAYFNPEEDKKNDEVDSYTGLYFVSCDY